MAANMSENMLACVCVFVGSCTHACLYTLKPSVFLYPGLGAVPRHGGYLPRRGGGPPQHKGGYHGQFVLNATNIVQNAVNIGKILQIVYRILDFVGFGTFYWPEVDFV